MPPAPPAQRRRPEVPGPEAVAPPSRNGAAVTGLVPPARPRVTGEPPHAALAAGAAKVGFARTPGGLTVSGTLVRSTVPVTGDESNGTIAITGESDQQPGDDLTARDARGVRRTPLPGAFAGRGLPRGVRGVAASGALENSNAGLPITGSAVGRSLRVTGDEAGTCRSISGDQYVSPDRVECGAALPPAEAIRRDPVSGGKVAFAQTRAGRRVSGASIERDARVTGTERGANAALTGTQYAAGAERDVAPPHLPVTGDTPERSERVSGAERGSSRELTGTPYWNGRVPEVATPKDAVASLDERFSVASPQRSAQLRAASRANGANGNGKITGAFASGGDKITGNREFLFVPRSPEAESARLRVTGEGRTGKGVTGSAWTEQTNVTGTDGAFAARNPSARAGSPRVVAGARAFKKFAEREEPKHLVTGTFGSDSGAKVTLSGGAQG